MQNGKPDLKERTKAYARRVIVRPARMSALLDEPRHLTAIFTTILNKSRGRT
jgi:hypothetical protein